MGFHCEKMWVRVSSGCWCPAVAAVVEGASVASSGLVSAHGVSVSTCGRCLFVPVVVGMSEVFCCLSSLS